MTSLLTDEELAQAKDKAHENLEHIIAARGGRDFEKRHDADSFRLYIDRVFKKIETEARQLPSLEALTSWLAQLQKEVHGSPGNVGGAEHEERLKLRESPGHLENRRNEFIERIEKERAEVVLIYDCIGEALGIGALARMEYQKLKAGSSQQSPS